MHFAARLSFMNRTALARAIDATCYHCLSSFLSSEVTRWTDDGGTALCPRCGIDSVLPGRVEPPLLTSAHAWGFEPVRPSGAPVPPRRA